MALRSFRLSDAEEAVVGAAGESCGAETQADALRHVLAQWGSWLMASYSPPIAVQLFGDLGDEGLLKLFRDFRLATTGAQGWRLAQVPSGGYWEKQGFSGKFYPLHDRRRFTANGIEDFLGDGPLPQNWLQ